MRAHIFTTLITAIGPVAVSAQNVGKFALCNNCVPTGSGAPVCTQNNYVHWGNEGDQGNCNDKTTVIKDACSGGSVDTPLGTGSYAPSSDCNSSGEPGTAAGSISGSGDGGDFKLDCFNEQDTFTDNCGASFACDIFLVCKPA